MTKALKGIVCTLAALLILLTITTIACAADASAAASTDGYSYVKSHTLFGSPDGNLSGYQVKLIVHRGSGTDSGPEVYLNGRPLSWPNDLRFTGEAGASLDYWIESADDESAVIWVEVSEIPTTGTSLNLLYGKADDRSASSIDRTFVFGDDFSGTELDAGKWARADFGSGDKALSISDGWLTLSAGPYAGLRLKGQASFDTPVVIETYFKVNTPSASDDRIRFAGSDVNANPLEHDIGLYANHGIPLIYWNDWSSTGFSRNTWYLSSETFQPSDRYKWTVKGVYTNSGSTSLTSISPYLGVGDYLNTPGVNDCGSLTVDWVIVRKYAQNEPSHGGWGKETLVEKAWPAPETSGFPPVYGYSHVKSHDIKGSPDGDLTGYQLKLVVHRGGGNDSGRDVYLNGRSLSWPNDLRFTDEAGNLLDYWVEPSTGDSAVVWVKVPAIPSSGTSIRLLYGKADDAGAGNGEATFDFFTGFDDLDQFDTQGNAYVSDGVAIIAPGENSWSRIISREPFPDGKRIRYSSKTAHNGYAKWIYEQFISTYDTEAWSGYENANYAHDLSGFYGKYEWRADRQQPSTTSLLGWSAGTYHTQELIRHGKSTWTVDDGNRVDTSASNYDSSPQYIGFKALGTEARVEVDWLFVANYTEHEPGHGSWSTEATPTPVPELSSSVSPTPSPAPQRNNATEGSWAGLNGVDTSTLCCFSGLVLVALTLVLLVGVMLGLVVKDLRKRARK